MLLLRLYLSFCESDYGSYQMKWSPYPLLVLYKALTQSYSNLNNFPKLEQVVYGVRDDYSR